MKKTLEVKPQGDREILVTRAFDAPRELVYQAYTRPELVKRWLGVWNGWSLDVCDMDLVVGGAYRWVWRKQGGGEMGVSGVYREITPPARIVCTERFDDSWYPGEGLVTVDFLEREPGKTSTLQLTLRYESQAARDGVVKSPMETGLAASYDALERLLGS
jgi:uncharacterized protein YndB with AHSA1/START domain